MFNRRKYFADLILGNIKSWDMKNLPPTKEEICEPYKNVQLRGVRDKRIEEDGKGSASV